MEGNFSGEVNIGKVEARLPLGKDFPPVPEYENIPKGPADVILDFGTGPVMPVMVGRSEERRPTIGKQGMREHVIATAEMVKHGMLSPEGVVIVSGRATAKPEDVEKAYLARQNIQQEGNIFADQMEARSFLKKPQSQEEIAIIKSTSEAGEMANLLLNAVPKGGRGENPLREDQIIIEDQAKNSIANVLNAVDLLDARSGGLWKGKIALVTTDSGHLRRVRDILHTVGFTDDQIVPLSAQKTLEHYGYQVENPEAWIKEMEGFKTGERRWGRGVRERAGYLMKQYSEIKSNPRLRLAMEKCEEWFGKSELDRLGIGNFRELMDGGNFDQVRANLTAINREAPENLPPAEWVNEGIEEQAKIIEDYRNLTARWLTDNAVTAPQTTNPTSI